MRPTLVIGRGLLGAALFDALSDPYSVSRPIRWGAPGTGADDLRREVHEFVSAHEDAAVAWCAGAGFVGASPELLSAETSALRAVLEATATHKTRLRLFFASSAGAVYGSGSPHILSEVDPASPASPYGWAKCEQEQLVNDWSASSGHSALVGRISNLYGPGQDINKPQGLISHLCKSLMTKRPMTIFVSSETQRDYLHADDAATRLTAWIEQAPARSATTKILASGQPTSVAQLLATAEAITRIRPAVVFAVNERTALQPRYLRFRSEVLPELDVAHPARSLAAGMRLLWNTSLARA